MINEARGKHVSPGIYTKEIDVTYAPKSLGVTTLGLAGETLKGPAFQPVSISNWGEFLDYFGGTSAEKFNRNGYVYPKYELPYIAKEYLKESKQLEVTRVLGLSGYNAGEGWAIIADLDSSHAKTAGSVAKSAKTTRTAKAASEKAASANLAENYVVCVLRSRGIAGEPTGTDLCGGGKGDDITFRAIGVEVKNATGIGFSVDCGTGKVKEETFAAKNPLDLTITVSGDSGEISYDVSLDPSRKNFILNVFGEDPVSGQPDVFVEEIYENAIMDLFDKYKDDLSFYSRSFSEICAEGDSDAAKYNYKESYRSAVTPWFVSEARGIGKDFDVKKLFRMYTISDGNASNSQIKVSISNILPEEGLFDVNIRSYYDSDANPVYLERFVKCSMNPASENYIGLKMGTYDGNYELRSKYVILEIAEGDDIYNSVPCGFLGYPMREYNSDKSSYEVIDKIEDENFTVVSPEDFDVNKKYKNAQYVSVTGQTPGGEPVTTYYKWNEDSNIDNVCLPIGVKYNKKKDLSIRDRRQFFGISNISGIDGDAFKYKGEEAYGQKLTKGFHLDERLSFSGATVTVDGEENSGFETVTSQGTNGKVAMIFTEDSMKGGMYENKAMRKFTACPCGGFDGWNIYRTCRSNDSNYRADKYAGIFYKGDGSERYLESLILPQRSNRSDYYAYLAGYNTFSNPEEVDINLFATPGIDWHNNSELVKDAIDMVEDFEYGRGGDALYIASSPKNFGQEERAEELVFPLSEEMKNSGIDSSYVCTYWPWVRCYDGVNKAYVDLPVTKDVVRNMAYVDNNSFPWMAPAGVTEKGKINCVRASYTTRCNEEDVLYEAMINPVKTFAVDGVKVWGNKTIYSKDTPLNRVNVRRLMIRVKKEISKACRSLIFEPNDMTVRSQFETIVSGILDNIRSNRGITDYKIDIDDSIEAIDQHTLPAKIWIKPTPTLEYIDLTFIITPQGGSFTD